jgi:hypothetical protein
MTCCNQNCNQGRDCPVRRAAATPLPITMAEDDAPPITFDYVMGWIINILAAIGAVAFAGLLGLYFSGFFHWLFERASAGG